MSKNKQLSESFYNQRGRINVEGREAAAFWIRALKLEEHIKFVQAKLYEKTERETAAVPIINEFKVDENLEFIYALQFKIDPIDVLDVIGVVHFCSPAHRAQILELRDKLGDQIMEVLREARRQGRFQEEIDTFATEPQSEAGGNRPPQTSRPPETDERE